MSFWYSHNVLNKKPFPAGEPAIATSALWSYQYARNILHGPFPAGESAIATDAEWAVQYAINVLKKQFPAGESTIANNPLWKEKYEKEFNVRL